MKISAHQGTGADYDDFVRLFAELQVADPVPDRAAWAERLAPNALFLSRGGANVAYAVAHAYGDTAYVAQVAVDPLLRRRGLGRLLLERLAERLRAAGCASLRLNVKVSNEAAIRLYSAFGLEVHHRSAVLRLPWSIIRRLPRDERPAAIMPAPEADEALERRWDLIAGQLARFRAQGDLLFAVEPAAFARYVPALGSMPFQAGELRAARALLEAMRGHAPAEASHVQVVVEGDEALAVALRDAGAGLVFELFQMRGRLP